MAIELLAHRFEESEFVELDLLISTVEKNRDRIRTIASMLLSFSGTLISFSSGFLLFTSDKTPTDHRTMGIFGTSVLAFLLAAALAIFSSFLRSKQSVSDKSDFLASLLRLYNSELLLLRTCGIVALVALLALVLGVASFVEARM